MLRRPFELPLPTTERFEKILLLLCHCTHDHRSVVRCGGPVPPCMVGDAAQWSLRYCAVGHSFHTS